MSKGRVVRLTNELDQMVKRAARKGENPGQTLARLVKELLAAAYPKKGKEK